MKIAIVGTSNSVMKSGWVPLFETLSPADWQAENLSIGGSASLHGNFSVDSAKVAKNFDFAFIEFAINDQQMIDIGNMSPEYVACSFASLLRHFAEPGGRCTPIVIIIPQRDLLDHERQDQAHNISVKLCERYGVAYIDLYAILRRLRDEDGVDPKGCFFDWTHLKPFAQEALAKAAVRAIAASKAGRRPSDIVLNEAPRFRAVEDGDIETNEHVRQEIGTSLTKKEVLTLAPGGRGVIKNVHYLCGIVHWIDPDSGALCFDGEDRKVKKGLRKEWTRLFGLTLLKEPLKAKNSTIPFHLGDSEGYVFERTFGMTPTTPVDGVRADLVGFIDCEAPPLEAGRALLARIGGAITPATTSREHLDAGFVHFLLASWVADRAGRDEPARQPAREPAPKIEPEAPAEPVQEKAAGAEVSYSRPAPHVLTIRIPHGSRTSVDLPISAGVMLLTSEVSLLRAMIGFRKGSAPQLHNLGVPVSNLKLVAESLVDQPPHDKHLTLGLGRSGKLEIENMRGGTVAFTLFLFG